MRWGCNVSCRSAAEPHSFSRRLCPLATSGHAVGWGAGMHEECAAESGHLRNSCTEQMQLRLSLTGAPSDCSVLFKDQRWLSALHSWGSGWNLRWAGNCHSSSSLKVDVQRFLMWVFTFWYDGGGGWGWGAVTACWVRDGLVIERLWVLSTSRSSGRMFFSRINYLC